MHRNENTQSSAQNLKFKTCVRRARTTERIACHFFFLIFHMRFAHASDKGAKRAWVNVRFMGTLSAERRPISEMTMEEEKKKRKQNESMNQESKNIPPEMSDSNQLISRVKKISTLTARQ